MGLPLTPTDSAPSYDDLYHNHPVNQAPPSGSASNYAPLPTIDIEIEPHLHSHSQTPLQDLGGSTPSTGHVHCELCDRREERKANRRKDLVCCALVAATFMVAFLIAFLIVGVVVKRAH